MPIPRYKDNKGRYEISLFCSKCGYAVVKGRHTMPRTQCRLCGETMQTRRTDYGRE